MCQEVVRNGNWPDNALREREEKRNEVMVLNVTQWVWDDGSECCMCDMRRRIVFGCLER